MLNFNNIMIITEDQVGEGSPLLFPRISSCLAVVACIGNTLVGAHFTADSWSGDDPGDFTKKLLDALVSKIGERNIDRLLTVGFSQHHNPEKIAGALKVPHHQWAAYDIGRKGINELTLIFTHQGIGVPVRIEYKRQTKVVTTKNQNPDWKPGDMGKGELGTATTGKLHKLRKHFV